LGGCGGISACVRPIQTLGGAPARRATVGYQRDFRHPLGKGNVRGAVTGRARHHYLLDRAGLAAGAPLLVYLVLRSRYGLALFRIRDSEATAKAQASIASAKLGFYVLSRPRPDDRCAHLFAEGPVFSPDAGFRCWIGALCDFHRHHRRGRTIEGPIVGVIVFYAMQHYLADFGTWYLILLGAVAIVIMLFAPKALGDSRAALPRRAISRAKNVGAAARVK